GSSPRGPGTAAGNRKGEAAVGPERGWSDKLEQEGGITHHHLAARLLIQAKRGNLGTPGLLPSLGDVRGTARCLDAPAELAIDVEYVAVTYPLEELVLGREGFVGDDEEIRLR